MSEVPPPAQQPHDSPAPANPGKTLGIVALILSILPLQLIGIILGFVARNQSKRAGQGNGFAVAAIIVGVIGLVIGLVLIFAGGAIFAGLFGVCSDLGPGVWEIDGVTYTCS
jgi:uncharacterized membrane protein